LWWQAYSGKLYLSRFRNKREDHDETTSLRTDSGRGGNGGVYGESTYTVNLSIQRGA